MPTNISFQSTIERLDQFITADAAAIKTKIEEFKHSEPPLVSSFDSYAFDTIIKLSKDPEKGTQEYKALSRKSGIYIFMIKTPCETNKNLNDVRLGAPFADRYQTHFEKNQILYIGSAQSLLNRMHAHFCKDTPYSKTGSLKLGSDNRKFLLGHVVVYAFCIRNEDRDYYPFFGRVTEKALHNKINCLAGNK